MLEYDLPGIWYYYWLIPSLISCLFSLAMMIHIFSTWSTDHSHYFQRACLCYGIFDILQDIGMIVNLFKGLCRLQYMLFITGSLMKAFVAVGGIGALYLVIIYHHIPSQKEIIRWSLRWFLTGLLVLSILFISDSNYELNCSENGHKNLVSVTDVSLSSQLFFFFTYCFSLFVCCLLVSYMSLRILYRFKSYSHFIAFRTTIFLYLFIFLFAVIPGCIYLLALAISHQYHHLILEITGLSLCSAGWLYSLSYFILTIFSPLLKRLLKIYRYYDKKGGGGGGGHLFLSSTPSSTLFERERDKEEDIEGEGEREGARLSNLSSSRDVDFITEEIERPTEYRSSEKETTSDFHAKLINSFTI